jgi:hypothetical protein
MAIGAGMTSAITNPLHADELAGVMGADVLMGHDPNCTRWIRRFREPAAEGSGEAGARGRREGRRRRGNGAPSAQPSASEPLPHDGEGRLLVARMAAIADAMETKPLE